MFKYLIVFVLLLAGCSTWQAPWNITEEPKMGEYEAQVNLNFVTRNYLHEICDNPVSGCLIGENSYYEAREGWSGKHTFSLNVHYVSWEDILDLCGGYACLHNDTMYVHDYAYWNKRGKLHYESWGTLIAQRLDLPERDLNVHCIIGHEVGFHQFSEHDDSSMYYAPTNCF